MIRLTLLLLAGIFVVMVVAGRGPAPRDRPAGESVAGAEIAEPPPEAFVPRPNRLDLADEAGAVERALAASDAPPADSPAAEPRPEAVAAGASSGRDAGLRSVAGNRVNMRSGPGTAFDVVGMLQDGDDVEVLEDPGDGWIKVEVRASGETGWMADFLLASD